MYANSLLHDLPVADGPVSIRASPFWVPRAANNCTMWVCGKSAYYFLPADWSGTCYLGFIVGALRPVDGLPLHPLPEHWWHRHKRSIINADAKKLGSHHVDSIVHSHFSRFQLPFSLCMVLSLPLRILGA